MIRTTLISALALTAAGAAPMAASAATFNLTGFPLGTTSQSDEEDGIQLEFSSEGGNLHFNGSGVGVTGGVSNLGSWRSAHLRIHAVYLGSRLH